MADLKPMALLWLVTTVLVCFQGSIHQVEAENKFLDVLQRLHRIKRFGDDGGFRAAWVPASSPWMTTNSTGNETTIPEGDGLPPPVFSCQGCIVGDGLPPIVPPILVPGKPQEPKQKVNSSGNHVGLSENKGIGHIIGNGKGRDKAEAGNKFLDVLQRLHRIKRFGDDGGFRADWVPPPPPWITTNATGNETTIPEGDGLPPPVFSCQGCNVGDGLPPIVLPIVVPGKPQEPKHKVNNSGKHVGLSGNKGIGHIIGIGKGRGKADRNKHHRRGNPLLDILQKVRDTLSKPLGTAEHGRSRQ